jgi:DNA-binding NarL/FixJ family response regulator
MTEKPLTIEGRSATTIRVAVADDHPAFRAGLRSLIQDSPQLTFVGEAADGGQAIALGASADPDVFLMDVRMPGSSGMEATRSLTATHPGIAVLMMTMLEDETSVFAAMRAGARGYILKGADPDEIVRAVIAVASGEVIFGAAVAETMRGFFAAGHHDPIHPFPSLTSRERDILDLIAGGRTNTDIAEQLQLSEKTIRNNVSNIFVKLRVADRGSAIATARDAGLPTRRAT